MRTLITWIVAVSLSLVSQTGSAEDLLLEDYEGNGPFSVANWGNTETDSEGNANVAQDVGEHATVSWATQWSGLPSAIAIEDALDLSKFKTYQVDVMVEEGQPVEQGAQFLVQLLCKADVGYAHWEAYIPQNLAPADGKWYRLRVPIDSMTAVAGRGANTPTDRKAIIGCHNGMAFDEDGSQFKFKQCSFDNVIVSTTEVEKVVAELVPEKVEKKKLADE